MLSLLTTDAENKTQEIIQEAKKLMRHSRRTVLTTEDVSNAMKKLQLDQIFGYPSTMPL